LKVGEAAAKAGDVILSDLERVGWRLSFYDELVQVRRVGERLVELGAQGGGVGHAVSPLASRAQVGWTRRSSTVTTQARPQTSHGCTGGL
jgi:hypothetical protein